MARYTTSIPIIVNRDPNWKALEDMMAAIKAGNMPEIGVEVPIPFKNGTVWDYIVAHITGNRYVYFMQKDATDTPVTDCLTTQQTKFSYAESGLKQYLESYYYNGQYPDIVKNSITSHTDTYTKEKYNGSDTTTLSSLVWIPSVRQISPNRNGEMRIAWQDTNGTDEQFAYYSDCDIYWSEGNLKYDKRIKKNFYLQNKTPTVSNQIRWLTSTTWDYHSTYKQRAQITGEVSTKVGISIWNDNGHVHWTNSGNQMDTIPLVPCFIIDKNLIS